MNNLNEITSYINRLPQNVIDSLREYTKESVYRELNYKLRMDETLDNVDLEIVKNIDFAFQNVPLLNNAITVYRGITKKYEYPLVSYISTSLSKSIALGFTTKDCCLLKILLPAGSNILPLGVISEKGLEQEILIGRNGSYLVTDINNKVRGTTEYNVVYIPPKSIDITLSRDTEDIKQIKDDNLNFELCVKRLLSFVIEEGEDEDYINSIVELMGVEDTIYDYAKEIGCDSEEIITETVNTYRRIKNLYVNK